MNLIDFKLLLSFFKPKNFDELFDAIRRKCPSETIRDYIDRLEAGR